MDAVDRARELAEMGLAPCVAVDYADRMTSAQIEYATRLSNMGLAPCVAVDRAMRDLP